MGPAPHNLGDLGQKWGMSDARPPVAHRRPLRHRARTWLAWWVLMMALWVMIDDSIQFDELLAGAGAAALAALGAEVAAYQASVRLGIGRGGGLAGEVLRLPAQVVKDTAAVFAALVRRRPPSGEYAEIALPALPGGPGPAGEAGRVLLTGIRSFAPGTFVVGLDPDRGTMLVHRLAAPRGSQPGGKP